MPGTGGVAEAGMRFRDAHVHLVPTGLARGRLPLAGLDLDGVREAVAGAANERPAGERIEGAGFALADLGLSRPPAAGDLDAVSPDHPIVLASHDLHALWVNTAALAAAGREPGSPSYFTEEEVRLFEDDLGRPEPGELRAAAAGAADAFLAAGVDRVQDHGRLEELAAVLALAREGVLPIRVTASIRSHQLGEYLADREAYSDVPGRVEVNGMKLFLDGALGSRTAWTLSPYAGGGTGHRALSRVQASVRVRDAAEAGLPTFFHAIGDAAVREALDLAGAFPGLPHRVEHAQLVHPDDLPRFARLGVAASMQPIHLLTDTPVMLELWGKERARRAFPVRSLLDSGAEVMFGSDSPVEGVDPWRGVFAAVERRTEDGIRLPGDETIPRDRALAAYAAILGR